MATDDYLSNLELSVKTTNLLRRHNVSEIQFLNMTKDRFRSLGGLVRGWKEIEEAQPVLKQIRVLRLRESTIGRAVRAVRELNDIHMDLIREQLFVTKDEQGRFRIGRYVTKEDVLNEHG